MLCIFFCFVVLCYAIETIKYILLYLSILYNMYTAYDQPIDDNIMHNFLLTKKKIIVKHELLFIWRALLGILTNLHKL